MKGHSTPAMDAQRIQAVKENVRFLVSASKPKTFYELILYRDQPLQYFDISFAWLQFTETEKDIYAVLKDKGNLALVLFSVSVLKNLR